MREADRNQTERTGRYCSVALLVLLTALVASYVFIGPVSAKAPTGSGGCTKVGGDWIGDCHKLCNKDDAPWLIERTVQLFATLGIALSMAVYFGSSAGGTIPFIGQEFERAMKEHRVNALGTLLKIVVVPVIFAVLVAETNQGLACIEILPFGLGG